MSDTTASGTRAVLGRWRSLWPPRITAGAALRFAVLAVPVVLLAALGWAERWITDDGFIYLRVVDQIREGNGPVFNAGQRVEAFTSPLWLAILAVAYLVTPVRLEWLAVVLGLGFSVAGVVMAMAGARLLVRRDASDAVLVPVGVLVFGATLPVWIFLTAGLENGLVFAWFGACLWILADWARRDPRQLRYWWAVVLGLGWLVRPELVLFSAAFLVLVLTVQWPEQRWRGRLALVAAAVAIPFVYQIFRMGYYGALVANTGIAKEGTEWRFERGWAYLRDFVEPYWLWLPLLALLAGAYVPLVLALRRQRAFAALSVVLTFFGVGLLASLYVVAVGGDYIHARLFMPALFALCAPVAVVTATKRYLFSLLVVVPWAIVAVVTLRPAHLDEFLVDFFALKHKGGRVTLEDAGWHETGEDLVWYSGPAYYYELDPFRAQYVRPDVATRSDVDLPLVVLSAVGASSFALGPEFNLLDTLGLGDAFTARLESTSAPVEGFFDFWLAGHEKPLPGPWIAARVIRDGEHVTAVDLPSSVHRLIPETDGEALQEQIAWARAALRCPEMQRLKAATEAPLTPRRFATNLVRSFSNTRVRIPPDPKEAYRTFCGDDTPPEVRALSQSPSTDARAPNRP